MNNKERSHLQICANNADEVKYLDDFVKMCKDYGFTQIGLFKLMFDKCADGIKEFFNKKEK